MPSTSSETLVATAGDNFSPGSHTTRSVALAAMETLRPHQWLKNLLVLVPLAAAHRLTESHLIVPALLAFAAFSLCASAVYVANDLHDIAADQQHPHKRFRPIASGRLPKPLAVSLVPALLGSAGLCAWSLGIWFSVVAAFYLGLMTAYTWRLKAVILLDAFALAAGYAMRVIAGSLAVDIYPSARLIAFCIFLFFSLALIKRYSELTLLGKRDGPTAHARGYQFEDQAFVLILGMACGVLSVLVLALYLSTGEFAQTYSHSQLIWLTCVLLLYWISHLWLMAHRGVMTDDPLVFAVKNPVSVALVVLMGVSAWLAI